MNPVSISNHRSLPKGHSPRGFTLVELMVAVAVGLIFSLAVTGFVLTMGRQFRVVGASAAAQGSAQIALSLIEASGRSAGAGFYNDGKPLCSTLNAWKDGAVKSNNEVFMPARIVAAPSGTGSEKVIFTSASDTKALSTMPVLVNQAASTDGFVVGNAGTIEVNDLAVAASNGPSTPCTLFQVTAVSGSIATCGGNASSCRTLSRAGAATGYNPPGAAFTINSVYGFDAASATSSGPAVVSRLGSSFRQDAFKVACGALVQYDEFAGDPSCTASPLSFDSGANALATDVVQMRAQYGISDMASSDVVTHWVNASDTVDATLKTWAAPLPGDVPRIKAVRVVVVTRSKEPESTDVSAACTNDASVANTGPCSFQGADAPVINVSGASMPSGRTWKNFRYRTYMAIVPLRNVIWSD